MSRMKGIFCYFREPSRHEYEHFTTFPVKFWTCICQIRINVGLISSRLATFYLFISIKTILIHSVVD